MNDDACGAVEIGMKGVLVRTGKYIENVEANARVPPTRVLDSFAAVVDWLIQKNFTV